MQKVVTKRDRLLQYYQQLARTAAAAPTAATTESNKKRKSIDNEAVRSRKHCLFKNKTRKD